MLSNKSIHADFTLEPDIGTRGMALGAIIGIVIGSIAGILLIMLVLYFLMRRNYLEDNGEIVRLQSTFHENGLSF